MPVDKCCLSFVCFRQELSCSSNSNDRDNDTDTDNETDTDDDNDGVNDPDSDNNNDKDKGTTTATAKTTTPTTTTKTTITTPSQKTHIGQSQLKKAFVAMKITLEDHKVWTHPKRYAQTPNYGIYVYTY